jgi:hypothetical protein
MSRTTHATSTTTPQQTARRAAIKTASIALVAHLRSYDARAAMGRLTPDRGSVKVTLPDSRERLEVTVTLADDVPVYTWDDPGTGDERVAGDVRSVRRSLVRPPTRFDRLVLHAFLFGIGWAVVAAIAPWPLEDSKHVAGTHWPLLVAAVVVATALSVLGLEARRARRRRRVEREGLRQLGGVAAARRR